MRTRRLESTQDNKLACNLNHNGSGFLSTRDRSGEIRLMNKFHNLAPSRPRHVLLLFAAIFAAQITICLPLSETQATLLDGNQITTAFYFPNQSTIGFGGVPVVSTVGPGVEIAKSPQGDPIASIDFSDTAITLDFFVTQVGTVAPFNGWRFYDVSGVTFTDATLVTSLPGWVVTFDPTDIWLNGSGASYFVGSTLEIDVAGVTFPGSVPEPATLSLMLMAIGLAGIGYSRCKGRSA